MTKLLNIGLMRQDFYHVIWKITQQGSFAVLQFCGGEVIQSWLQYRMRSAQWNNDRLMQLPLLLRVEL
jgi:hypothetical protein